MVYDSRRDRIVMWGGFLHADDPRRAEEWDGQRWQQREPGDAPVRFDHAMAYDEARGVTVVFGGWKQYWEATGDTWTYDEETWKQVATDGPSPRADCEMVYDSARQVIVLFGGSSGDGQKLDDTWEWDGAAWRLVDTSGPSARSSHAMCFDSWREVTVLYGGDGDDIGETWEYDGSHWKQVETRGPRKASGHALAFDAARGVAVMLVGYAVWAYDGTAWTFVDSRDVAWRHSHALTFHAVLGETFLFGGNEGSWEPYPLADCWSWNGERWRFYGAPRAPHGTAYDRERGVLVVNSSPNGAYGDRYTFEWDGTAWEVRTTESPVRAVWSGAFDESRETTVAYGGYSQFSSAVHEWDG